MEKPKITVVGSANVDFLTTIDKMPKVGETVFGNKFSVSPGGKGANQAVAAARMGGDVTFIGCVGEDEYGAMLIDNFKKENINISNVSISKKSSTGIANIVVSKDDNSIIVVPGANKDISIEDINKLKNVIIDSEIILIQLEIPENVVNYVIDIAYSNNVKVVLNPAPAATCKEIDLSKVDFITPNFIEAQQITNEKVMSKIFRKFKLLNIKNVIITNGKNGISYTDEMNRAPVFMETYKVESIDPTGAGDTFNGVLSYFLARKEPLSLALLYATYAAALSTTKVGAQKAMPYFKEINNKYNLEE